MYNVYIKKYLYVFLSVFRQFLQCYDYVLQNREPIANFP